MRYRRAARAALIASLLLAACSRSEPTPTEEPKTSTPLAVPESLPMGGDKSVMSFFITSAGTGKGGDLGGLAGADAHCQALATAEGAGDHTWRAYLSTVATETAPGVDARDRIGKGPWYNAEGFLVAADLEQLHGAAARISKDTAVTEKLDMVPGVSDTPNTHDILTGSRPDGTAFPAGGLTCGNWTSSSAGRAQAGHHDRMGQGEAANSWNSAHPTRGCSQADLEATGGAGLFYCFAID
jgi:hypothetical protein